MLQLSQSPRFAHDVGRDLEGHESVGQIALASKEYPAERSPAEFAAELEPEEVRSDPRQARHRTGQPLRCVRISPVQGAKKLGLLRWHVMCVEEEIQLLRIVGSFLAILRDRHLPPVQSRSIDRQTAPTDPDTSAPPAARDGTPGGKGQSRSARPKRRRYSAGVGTSPACCLSLYSS